MSPKTIKRIFVFLILVPTLVFADSINEFLTRGEKFYREKNYRQALGQFKFAIDLNPNSNRAHLGYAKTSLALGSRLDSLNSYKKVLESEPKHKEALSGVAEITSLEGAHSEALELIEEGLKEEPYNSILLIERATILLRMGKSNLALRRLVEARSKVNTNYEYTLLLARAYTANKDYRTAAEIIENLRKEYPENPEVFYEKAFLHFQLASNEEDPEKREIEMKESFSLLETALSLEPRYHDARRLAIQVLIWLGEYENAYEYVKMLSEDFTFDTTLLHYQSYLAMKLGNKEAIIQGYTKLLNEDEMNEVARFTIEEYALKNLTEIDPLRNRLGLYRYKLYERTSSDLQYKIANYHLLRASLLIPENGKLKNTMTDYYNRFADKPKLLAELLRERKEDPDNIKINNRIENLLKSMRHSLGYVEGYKNTEGLLIDNIRSVPEIFLFDLKPNDFMTDYPDTTDVITASLRYSLSMKPQISIVGGEEERVIRDAIKTVKGKTHFSDSVFYSADVLDLLNRNRKKDNYIRFIGYGNFQKNGDHLSVRYNIYDRTTGTIVKKIKISSYGRNSLEDLSSRLSNKIVMSMPIQGKILKIKNDSIVFNLGSRDGLKKNDVLKILKNGKVYSDIKVTSLDDFVAEAEVIDNPSWKKDVGRGFWIVADRKFKRREVSP